MRAHVWHPVRLLTAYYRRLDVKLVLMNGSRCAYIWAPGDWETRCQDARVTVILNVWSDHVSTYTEETGNHAPPQPETWAEDLLVTDKAEDDAHSYDDMLPLDWSQLLEAWHERRKVAFWTTEPIKSLEDGLRANNLSFVPH